MVDLVSVVPFFMKEEEAGIELTLVAGNFLNTFTGAVNLNTATPTGSLTPKQFIFNNVKYTIREWYSRVFEGNQIVQVLIAPLTFTTAGGRVDLGQGDIIAMSDFNQIAPRITTGALTRGYTVGSTYTIRILN